MIKYIVAFEENTMILSGEELNEFVQTAVVANKDIKNFSVRRINLKVNVY